jgi:hypothetical protein
VFSLIIDIYRYTDLGRMQSRLPTYHLYSTLDTMEIAVHATRPVLDPGWRFLYAGNLLRLFG